MAGVQSRREGPAEPRFALHGTGSPPSGNWLQRPQKGPQIHLRFFYPQTHAQSQTPRSSLQTPPSSSRTRSSPTYPAYLTVGPPARRKTGRKSPQASFWTPDTGCLEWLDDQRQRSVVLTSPSAASPSSSQTPVPGACSGLELAENLPLGRPGPSSIAAFPAGFAERVADKREDCRVVTTSRKG
ncbi:hypothetical protein AXF42_Ash013436 [Apostasia shenzhenica]|uniref:Uncharacterized protein n=1 Tax=Apostasia shenzhenica TaxID=1088818 RepID=A0A2I0A475_9ASPA|nr:hypothetical protein AXF42_Ash013436 [Apostasia shenzhenica]